jgi:HD-GYP domain-containing protein (c-di-GMP phosphodiesterase class II)
MAEGWQFFRRWDAPRESEDEERSRRHAEAHLHMAQALSFALELKDPGMHIAGHCARVAATACAIGEELGLSRAEMDVLRHAAELHEVGMIAVPSELVHRPGPLSRAELERLRAQAAVGAEIVRAVYNLQTARIIEHQYDDYEELQRKRLSDRELLLAGILRVADVLDAVTTPRAYQRPLPPERRAEVLREGMATRFHPVAASAAIRLQEA